MTATFGVDLVDKTKQAKVNAIKARLKSAAKAADQLESDVRWLVSNRAWETLGYFNFSEMWEKENGYAPPAIAKMLAADALMQEGMNTSRGPNSGTTRKNGHTNTDVARAIGYAVHNQGGIEIAPSVAALRVQRDHGVPVERRSSDPGKSGAIVGKYGDTPYVRKRSSPRRSGKAPEELVSASAYVPRADDDAIAEIARQANVPKAEIYRQAVAEYLMRHRESRPGAAS